MKYPLASIKAYDVYVFLALFLFDRGMLISFFLYVATSSRTRLSPAYELIYPHAFLLDLHVFT